MFGCSPLQKQQYLNVGPRQSSCLQFHQRLFYKHTNTKQAKIREIIKIFFHSFFFFFFFYSILPR